MATISLRIPDTLLTEVTRHSKEMHISRTEYIRNSLIRRNKTGKTRPVLIVRDQVLIDQLRAIDNRRLIEGPLLECSDEFMLGVDQCMQEVLGVFGPTR